MNELIPTRATLLQRLKNWQDQTSWQDFFDTYWKLIYDVARKAGMTDAEAEDIVQETMISVARHMPEFKYDPSIGSFKAWLLNVTRWRIADQHRRRRSVSKGGWLSIDEPLDHDISGAGPSIDIADPRSADLEAMWEAEWESHLLEAAIAKVKRRLDPLKYQIFDLYVNKDWPPARVAEAFQLPVDQVYLVKHRVTDMIKDEVRRLESEMT